LSSSCDMEYFLRLGLAITFAAVSEALGTSTEPNFISASNNYSEFSHVKGTSDNFNFYMT